MLYGIIMKKMGKLAALGFMIALIGIPVACGPKSVSQEQAGTPKSSVESAEPGSKKIRAISVTEGADSTVVSITGNRRLTYTSVKQPLPMGLVLYFPETGLDAEQTDIAVNGDLVDSVKAAELIENGPTKILIALKKDVPYRMSQEDDGLVLKVTLSQASVEISEGADVPEMAAAVEEQPISEEPIPAAEEPAVSEPVAVESAVVADVSGTEQVATRLSGIEIKADGDFLEVHIQTDGQVKKYNHFTLATPARIVIDLYGLRISETKMKTLAVDSRWAKSVRYLGYPDYVRVVIDTESDSLNAYTADSKSDGIYVRFGDTPSSTQSSVETGMPESESVQAEQVEQAAAEVETPVSETTGGEPEIEAEPAQQASVAPDAAIHAEEGGGSAAWLKSIEFFSEGSGESTLIIETTRPAKYVLKRVKDRQLELDLLNTRISSNRQRPLITTRFESALDRILPVHNASLGRNSKVIIELREDVAYTDTLEDSRLQIRFAASSVPPRPLEEAGLPDWEAVLEKTKIETEDEPVATPSAPAEIEPLEPIVAEVTEAEMPAQIEENTDKMSAAPMSGFEPIGDLDAADDAEEEEEGVVAENEFADLYSFRQKRYTGEKIALDFYQTDIKNVLRILRDVSGKNFAIDKDVKGMVTLSLVKPVPWDQVLDLILKMNGLGYMYEGDIIRIATLKTVQAEEARRQEALSNRQAIKDKEILLEDLETRYIPVSYSDAKKLLNHVNVVVTTRGKTSVDDRTNQIIMTDVPSAIDKAIDIVKRLDKVTPQVLIEARIVEVTDTFSRTLGAGWDMGGGPVQRHELGGEYSWDVAMNRGSLPAQGVGINFQRILGTPFSLNARLAAMESQGEGTIISSPKILTLDNVKASIQQGINYPYLGVDSNGLATTMFKEVTLKLDVTPMVTPDNRISLKVKIDKEDIYRETAQGPATTTNQAQTELLVNDGDTIVIGGILKNSETFNEERMPWLNKIPVLGWLFKTDTTGSARNELLMFLTPRIVQLEQR